MFTVEAACQYMSSFVNDEAQSQVARQRWWSLRTLACWVSQCYSAFYQHWILLRQTQDFMRGVAISQYCIWWSAINVERASPAYGSGSCVCTHECLAGRSGAWGSAMPPTVVYLGLVHAPLGGVDPRGAVPQHSSISGCANLATMLWHSRFSSGPAFSLLSCFSPTSGLPKWDRGERVSLVQLWETTHCSATQKTRFARVWTDFMFWIHLLLLKRHIQVLSSCLLAGQRNTSQYFPRFSWKSVK